jgi:hypothetical protein
MVFRWRHIDVEALSQLRGFGFREWVIRSRQASVMRQTRLTRFVTGQLIEDQIVDFRCKRKDKSPR